MPKKNKYIEKFPVEDDEKKKREYDHSITKQDIDFIFNWCTDFRLPLNNVGERSVIRYAGQKMTYTSSEKGVNVPHGKFAYMVLSYICTELKLKDFTSPNVYFGKINEIAKNIGINNPRGKQLEKIKEAVKGFAYLFMNLEISNDKTGGTAGLNMRFCENYALFDEVLTKKGILYYTVLRIAPEMLLFIKNNILPYDFRRFKKLKEFDIPVFFWLTRSYYLLFKKNERDHNIKSKFFDWKYLIKMFGEKVKNDTSDQSTWIYNFSKKLDRIKIIFNEFEFNYNDRGVTLLKSKLQVPDSEKDIRYITASKEIINQQEFEFQNI
jgi:hypothetical protein